LQTALEPYKAAGVRGAMYLLPAVNLALAAVLFAGTRTVAADAQKLQDWMRDATADDEPAPYDARPGNEVSRAR
jgi:hypothetical protein